MHILQIESDPFFSSYGGGQVYIRNIVDEMIRQGNAVVTMLLLVGAENTTKKVYNGCTLYECKELNDGELATLINEIQPDIIHAHNHKGRICKIGVLLGIPVVVTSHDGGIVCPAGTLLNCKDAICQLEMSHRHCLRCCLRNIRTGTYWYPFMQLLPKKTYLHLGRWLQKKQYILFITPIGEAALQIQNKQHEWQNIICNCSQIIAPSEAMKEAMLRNGLSERIVKVVPHGIPLPQMRPSFPSTKDGVKFFYLGRICYVKGLHLLLKAFNKLSNCNVELHIIGKAANKVERRYEDKLRRKYQSDSRIIWHGKVAHEEVYNTIKDFHISVSVSIFLESFGLNITESLAMGKPVLASQCGGAEMQIEDGVNGWLVPTNNVEAIRQKMESIINTPESQLANMAGKKSVMSIEQHCKELMSIYKNIITNK